MYLPHVYNIILKLYQLFIYLDFIFCIRNTSKAAVDQN